MQAADGRQIGGLRVEIWPPEAALPVERAWALSMSIRAFKGRRDVEVHLFRAVWDPAEETVCEWDVLIEGAADAVESAGSRKVVLEAFTLAERDLIIDFLCRTYEDRLTIVSARPLSFPVPLGLLPLTEARVGKAAGFIDFLRIPRYALPFPLKGFYDLDQHKPIIDTRD